MRKVFLFLGSLFSIIGNVIGAGFITGREIATFFCDDFSLSLCYCSFLVFSYCFYFALKSGDGSGGAFVNISACANVIISSCMVSGLRELFCGISFLRQTENIEIFVIISAIIAFFISARGMGFVNGFSLVFIPISLVVLFATLFSVCKAECFLSVNVFSSERGMNFLHSPLVYVCLNVFLSLPVLKSTGVKFSKKGNLILSLFVSLILTFFIFLISAAIVFRGSRLETMPLVSLASGNDVFYRLINTICFVGIYSTLVCSYYSAISLFGKKYYFAKCFLLFLITLFLSKFGFGAIVNYFYPFIGVLGLVYIFFSIFSGKVFPPKIRERTLHPREGIKSKCLP